MYGIYANIWGILMVNVTIYIAYMDPMGYSIGVANDCPKNSLEVMPSEGVSARFVLSPN
jgi:hypothetical protein